MNTRNVCMNDSKKKERKEKRTFCASNIKINEDDRDVVNIGIRRISLDAQRTAYVNRIQFCEELRRDRTRF